MKELLVRFYKNTIRDIKGIKFNVFNVMLIIICIAINFFEKLTFENFTLPIYGDSLGTCIAACLGGPIIGSICGILNNVLYGMIVDNISAYYCLTSIGLSFVVGIMARNGMMKNLISAYATAGAATFTSIAISYPLNIILYDGYTGNVFGDSAINMFLDANVSIYIAEYFAEFIIELPDKYISIYITYLIYCYLKSQYWFTEMCKDSVESGDDYGI